MNESPLARLDPPQLKELVELSESGGFGLLLQILGEIMHGSTESLKIIGDPEIDLQRLAHWRGQAHTMCFLQNLRKAVDFETTRRDELETAMMNQGELFHNPHPSTLHLPQVSFNTSKNPFVVK